MKAALLREYGLGSRFSSEETPVPTPGVGEVLIRIAASGVNPADFKAKELGNALEFAPVLPAVLGMDVGGTVVSVGPGVAQFNVGDRIFGCAGGVGTLAGSLAEYMVADSRLLAKAPKNLDIYAATALPLAGITAWEGIVERGRVQPGQRVLVHGGGGGVGSLAVQLARALGAFVVTTELTSRLELARLAGADVVIDASQPTLDDELLDLSGGRGFDVVFDTIGGSHLERSFVQTKLRGKVVTTIGFAAVDLSAMHGRALSLDVIYMLLPMMTGRNREEHGKIFDALAELAERERIRPLVDKREFSLAQANEAYDYASSGKSQGKVIVKVS